MTGDEIFPCHCRAYVIGFCESYSGSCVYMDRVTSRNNDGTSL